MANNYRSVTVLKLEETKRRGYLELDLERGTLTVGFDDIDTVPEPEEVFHGRVNRYPVGGPISVSEANELLGDSRIVDLADDIFNGSFIERSIGGYLYGSLNGPALDAEVSLEALLEQYTGKGEAR